VKFRRKKAEPPVTEPGSVEETPEPSEAAESPEPAGARRERGPWDISEVDVEEGDTKRIDLGSLIVPAREGLNVQLQVDERSGQVAAVMLAGEKGAVELRAFAAPRNGDIWEDVRRDLAAEVTRRGGTATEAEGPWGPELRVVLSVKMPDGKQGQQPSRVYGIPGPRWLLRATLFGQPALEPVGDGLVESALHEVVVRRGSEPHAPGEALPLRVPPELVRSGEEPGAAPPPR
jgi:hypothetical protein